MSYWPAGLCRTVHRRPRKQARASERQAAGAPVATPAQRLLLTERHQQLSYFIGSGPDCMTHCLQAEAEKKVCAARKTHPQKTALLMRVSCELHATSTASPLQRMALLRPCACSSSHARVDSERYPWRCGKTPSTPSGESCQWCVMDATALLLCCARGGTCFATRWHVTAHEQVDQRHVRVRTLVQARWDDPNSGGASFSITLGPAPHLDMHYTVRQIC